MTLNCIPSELYPIVQNRQNDNNRFKFERLHEELVIKITSFLSFQEMAKLSTVNRFFYSKRKENLSCIQGEYKEECTRIFCEALGQPALPRAISDHFKGSTLSNLVKVQRMAAKALFDTIFENEGRISPAESSFQVLNQECLARTYPLTGRQKEELKTINALITGEKLYVAERVSSFIRNLNTRFLAQKHIAKSLAERGLFKECIRVIGELNEVYQKEQSVTFLFKRLSQNYSSSELRSIFEPRLSGEKALLKSIIYAELVKKLSLDRKVDEASSLLEKIESQSSKESAIKELAQAYARMGNIEKVLELARQQKLNGFSTHRVLELGSNRLMDQGYFQQSLNVMNRITFAGHAKRAYFYCVREALKKQPQDLEAVRETLRAFLEGDQLSFFGKTTILDFLAVEGERDLVLEEIEKLSDPDRKDEYYLGLGSLCVFRNGYDDIFAFFRKVSCQDRLIEKLGGIFDYALDSLPRNTTLSLVDLIQEPRLKDEMIRKLRFRLFSRERAPFFEELIFKCTDQALKLTLYSLVYNAYASQEEKDRLQLRFYSLPAAQLDVVSVPGQKRQRTH